MSNTIPSICPDCGGKVERPPEYYHHQCQSCGAMWDWHGERVQEMKRAAMTPEPTPPDPIEAIRQWIIDDANGYGTEHWDECAGTAIGYLQEVLTKLDWYAKELQAANQYADNERQRRSDAERREQWLASVGLTLRDGEIWDPEREAKVRRIYAEDGTVHTALHWSFEVKCGEQVGVRGKWLRTDPQPGVEYRECISCFMGTITKRSATADAGRDADGDGGA